MHMALLKGIYWKYTVDCVQALCKQVIQSKEEGKKTANKTAHFYDPAFIH